jgi:hypothetical protein
MNRGMKALDGLQLVGWYAMGTVAALAAGYVFGRRFGAPTQPIVVFLAAGAAARAPVLAYPLPGRPLLIAMTKLMALGGLAVAVGEATVGWDMGWETALALAGLAAVFYPLLFNGVARRKAREAALAIDAST